MKKCRGCGREIVWAYTPEGKAIPLDATAPVYRVADGHCERDRECYVTHFATCSHASEFSKGGKKRDEILPSDD